MDDDAESRKLCCTCTTDKPRHKKVTSHYIYHMPIVRLSLLLYVQSLFVPDLDFIRVLSDVRVNSLLDQVAFTACNPQDQVV